MTKQLVQILGWDKEKEKSYPISDLTTPDKCKSWNNQRVPANLIPLDIDGKDIQDSLKIYKEKISPVLWDLVDKGELSVYEAYITRRSVWVLLPFQKNLSKDQKIAWVKKYFPDLIGKIIDKSLLGNSLMPRFDGETPHYKTGKVPEHLGKYGKGINQIPEWLENIKSEEIKSARNTKLNKTVSEILADPKPSEGDRVSIVMKLYKQGKGIQDILDYIDINNKWKGYDPSITGKKIIGIIDTYGRDKPIETTEPEGEVLQNDFFKCLLKETEKKIVGEEAARHTILLVGLGGSLVDNASPTSSNLCVNDDSGVGKDYVVNNSLQIFKKRKCVQKKSRISPTVYTYWHHDEPEWTWNGQIQYLEDISNTILNCETFKTYSSGGTSAAIVVNQKAIDIEIDGKPVLIITTASADPDPELLRRFPILSLDSGIDQTRAIMKRQAKAAADGTVFDYDEKLMKSLLSLKRVKVKVPFAEKIEPFINSGHTIMRTHFPRFLDFVKFSTAIHQHTRKHDKDGYVIASGEDYDIARTALIAITSNALSVPLTKKRKKLLESLITERTYTCREIEAVTKGIGNPKTLRNQLDQLTDLGFLEKDTENREEKRPAVIVYRKLEMPDISKLPTWEELENGK